MKYCYGVLQGALWGFKYGDTPIGNPYAALMVEPLHQTDQGVFRHLIELLNQTMFTSDMLESLDKRMQLLKDEYHNPSLPNIPGYGFWQNNTSVTAHEYRNVLQVKAITRICSQIAN